MASEWLAAAAAMSDWQQLGASLAALYLSSRVAAQLYARVTMSDAERNAPQVPRPKGTLPFLRNTLQALAHSADFHDFWAELSDEYDGATVQVKMLGRPEIITVATPQLFEDVLKTHFENFAKGPYLNSVTSDLLGNGIFAVDGPQWVRQRKMVSNLFSLRMLRESMAESVHKHVKVLARVLQHHVDTKTPADIANLMNRFTIETFAEIGFGVNLESLETVEEHPFAIAFDRAQRLLVERFLRPPWFWKTQRWLNVGVEGELKQNIRVIHDTVFEIIDKSLENRKLRQNKEDENKKDIISLFLDNASYDGADTSDKFDPELLRDIVVGFLIAGRDTTSQALAWFLYNITQHPDVERKIREELTRELPGLMRGEIESPSMEQSHQLVFMEAALNESLRLHPPVPGNLKQAMKDVVLSDGTFVKAGWSVSVAPYTLARMKGVWGPDAREYKPDRWIDPATGKIIPVSVYKFATFNAGPRMCLGMNLAMMEVKIVVASLLAKFRLELVPDQTVVYDFSVSLPVKGALMMNILPVNAKTM